MKKNSSKIVGFVAVSALMLSASLYAQVDFVTQIKPILEYNCLSCHHTEEAKGGLSLSTKEEALAGSENGDVIVPRDLDNSYIYVLVALDADDTDRMPPKSEGDPLSEESIALIRTC